MDILSQYITYGFDKIHFELQPKKNDNNRIIIKVQPDCNVIVLAPPSATTDEIIVAVNKRARWVHNKLKAFKVQHEQILPRQYVSGESHHYLGQRYLLKILEDTDLKQSVKLLRGRIEVNAPHDKSIIQSLLSHWYDTKANEVFNRRLDALLSMAYWVNNRPDIGLKSMRSQWGSCSSGGKITLNTHLVKAPTECIDYVILHELCHIAERNHSDKFYRLLHQVNPGWEKTKRYLDHRANMYIPA